ncbi:MAG TPA: class I SAM-dependent methyltransferase [Polyangiaceae bacterium]|jgi:SAM-dependent methyltransferase|nr:class I SAM-dependent methyltransferase [Polyangiaceae bacterium]
MNNGPSFGDAVAAFYEQYMVPMVFAPYAADLVARVSSRPMGDVLETTAGTGVVTRKLAAVRANAARAIVATDLSQAMLDRGKSLCPDSIVEWRQADAMSLPFPDASFDLVVSQFGAMFFRDRPQAYREARRVLRPGGRFVFSVWDRVEANDFAHTASEAVAQLFPGNPPTFVARVPHGYFDTALIAADIAKAGFEAPPSIEPVSKTSRAESATIAAQAFVRGTPLRSEIEERDAAMLETAVTTAERALTARFGNGPVEGRMRAFVIEVPR